VPHDKRKRPWFPCANRPSASRRIRRAGPFAALLWPHLIGFIKEHGDRKGWISARHLDPGDVAEWAGLPDTDEWIGQVADAIEAIKRPTVESRAPMLQADEDGWRIDPTVWEEYEHKDSAKVNEWRERQRNAAPSDPLQSSATNCNPVQPTVTDCSLHPVTSGNILSRDNDNDNDRHKYLIKSPTGTKGVQGEPAASGLTVEQEARAKIDRERERQHKRAVATEVTRLRAEQHPRWADGVAVIQSINAWGRHKFRRPSDELLAMLDVLDRDGDQNPSDTAALLWRYCWIKWKPEMCNLASVYREKNWPRHLPKAEQWRDEGNDTGRAPEPDPF
jgi:hypothetical protein